VALYEPINTEPATTATHGLNLKPVNRPRNRELQDRAMSPYQRTAATIAPHRRAYLRAAGGAPLRPARRPHKPAGRGGVGPLPL
jgi:hypothetical protein